MPAVEVLLGTPAVREVLREPTRTGDLRRIMADGRKTLGTQTFEQHVNELLLAGTLTPETAKAALSVGAPTPVPTGKKGSKQAASS